MYCLRYRPYLGFRIQGVYLMVRRTSQLLVARVRGLLAV